MTDETNQTNAEADAIVDNGSQVKLLIPGVFDGMAGLAQGIIAFIPNRACLPSKLEFAATVDGKSVQMTAARCGKGPMYAGTYYEV